MLAGEETMNIKAALILGVAIIFAVLVWMYFTPYQSCVREVSRLGVGSPAIRCAQLLRGKS